MGVASDLRRCHLLISKHAPAVQGYDVLEDMYSSKTAATNLLHTLCERKPKTYLEKLMGHIVSVLNEHNGAVAAGNVPMDLARRMDGAILAIGTLQDVLKKKVCL